MRARSISQSRPRPIHPTNARARGRRETASADGSGRRRKRARRCARRSTTSREYHGPTYLLAERGARYAADEAARHREQPLGLGALVVRGRRAAHRARRRAALGARARDGERRRRAWSVGRSGRSTTRALANGLGLADGTVERGAAQCGGALRCRTAAALRCAALACVAIAERKRRERVDRRGVELERPATAAPTASAAALKPHSLTHGAAIYRCSR